MEQGPGNIDPAAYLVVKVKKLRGICSSDVFLSLEEFLESACDRRLESFSDADGYNIACF